MTREEIKNKVTAIVADKTGFPSSGIKDNTSFKYDLGTDSLDEVEIVMEFEREFGIAIKDEETMGVVTVGDAIDVICKKLDVSICKQQHPEVDLEKELDQWRHEHFKGKRDGDYSGEYLERESQLDLARRFYELGCRHTAVMYDDIEFERQRRQEDEPTIKGWVARDKDDTLVLGRRCPERIMNIGAWMGFAQCMKIEKELFPELKWEDEPIEVELTIHRV